MSQPAKPSLVTSFHLLLLAVTLAITGVGLLRIPADYAFPAHWSGSTADWLWPRDLGLAVGPVLQVVLIALFFVLGQLLTKNHFAKTQHIFDPALSLLLAVIAATQLGLLFNGIGSDLDIVRIASLGLGAALTLLGVILFEAERHTYAGLRMPWPIASDRAWRLVHRCCGIAFGLAGLGLVALAWRDAGIGIMVAAFALALLIPPMFAGLVSFATRGR